MDITEQILTSTEVGKRLNLSAERVRQLERTGHLRAVRTTNGIRLFAASVVEEFLKHRQSKRGSVR